MTFLIAAIFAAAALVGAAALYDAIQGGLQAWEERADDLSTRPNGDRRCRACHRDQQRAYRRLAAHEERDQS